MREHGTMMSQNRNTFPRENSMRIVLFADLRNSTDILLNFEKGIYKKLEGQSEYRLDYGEFILDVHDTAYKELYLGHKDTYAEIYGDGFMGVFPEDNTKYILENIYRFSNKMRLYNDSQRVGVFGPKIDMGFGVTVGEVTFVYYPLDERHHPVGCCIHEAARIQGVSRLYDARVLVSHRFFNFAEVMISSDSRFSYRFIDRVILRNFREPSTLYEILLDNDPRFETKKGSIQIYSEAYSKYCEKKRREAKEIFYTIYQEYGLGIGATMAKRCDILAANPPNPNWDGIWKLKNK